MNEQRFFNFYTWLNSSILKSYQDKIKQSIAYILEEKYHGDMQRWSHAVNTLPDIQTDSVELNKSVLSVISSSVSEKQKQTLHQCLQGLMPWRKGPYDFFGDYIDTEWRSDFKWNRIAPHLSSLKGRLILDVGCGSGYHCWRMLGAGAKRVIGVDPSRLFMLQFFAFKTYAGLQLPVDLLPLRLEEFPAKTNAFDTVFSMGVLYHRKSPLEHLESLFQQLRPGGELVLETLVIEGEEQSVLVPGNRYGKMRNVWFLPSAIHLSNWLSRLGFINIKIVDINQTNTDEQRSTNWMNYQSLSDFLNPENKNQTIEGYPAPLRATLVANRPF